MTRNALIDPKIEMFYKKLICYQKAKFHQLGREIFFFKFCDVTVTL